MEARDKIVIALNYNILSIKLKIKIKRAHFCAPFTLYPEIFDRKFHPEPPYIPCRGEGLTLHPAYNACMVASSPLILACSFAISYFSALGMKMKRPLNMALMSPFDRAFFRASKHSG